MAAAPVSVGGADAERPGALHPPRNPRAWAMRGSLFGKLCGGNGAGSWCRVDAGGDGSGLFCGRLGPGCSSLRTGGGSGAASARAAGRARLLTGECSRSALSCRSLLDRTLRRGTSKPPFAACAASRRHGTASVLTKHQFASNAPTLGLGASRPQRTSPRAETSHSLLALLKQGFCRKAT